MLFYNNRYYYLNKVFLSIVGVWPYQSRLEGNVKASVALLCLCGYMALQWWGLISDITNLSVIVENFSPILMITIITIKLLNQVINRYKVKELLDQIEETWEMVQTGPENEILRNYAKETRTFTIQYTWLIFAIGISYISTPLVTSKIYTLLSTNETFEARFLFRLEHVLDMEKYFGLLMLHASINYFYVATVLIAADGIFVLCIQHTCALFENIRYNMERIRASDCVMLKPNITDDEAYHIIIDCIKSHNHALHFSETLCSIYATCFLLMLGVVVVSLSFSTAQFVLLDNPVEEIIRIVGGNVAQLVHIYYLSLMSQQLIDYSSGMKEVSYNCAWYMTSLRSRQLLKLTLLRTIKPCQIMAGKVFVLSMENFGAILRATMSYFMMLISLQ